MQMQNEKRPITTSTHARKKNRDNRVSGALVARGRGRLLGAFRYNLGKLCALLIEQHYAAAATLRLLTSINKGRVIIPTSSSNHVAGSGTASIETSLNRDPTTAD